MPVLPKQHIVQVPAPRCAYTEQPLRKTMLRLLVTFGQRPRRYHRAWGIMTVTTLLPRISPPYPNPTAIFPQPSPPVPLENVDKPSSNAVSPTEGSDPLVFQIPREDSSSFAKKKRKSRWLLSSMFRARSHFARGSLPLNDPKSGPVFSFSSF